MFLDGIRKFLKANGRDVTIFLMSLLLAFSVWLIYNLTLNYKKVVSVPVVAYSNLDGHKQTSSNSVVVMGRCHTRGFDLLRIEKASEKKPIVVNFNSSDLHHKSGEVFYITSFELNRYVKEIFGDKAGMETFVTDSLFFRFPFENSKKVPVRPVYSLSFQPQYMAVGGMSVSPDSVTIYGEPYHLENIEAVFTRPFNLQNLKNSEHGEVHLASLNGVRLSTETVEYMVNVQRYVEITVNMPIRSRNVPANKSFVIYPSIAKVTFKCAFPMSVQPEKDVHFYVDYNDFQKSLGGKCLAKTDPLSPEIYSYQIEPEVFECVDGNL